MSWLKVGNVMTITDAHEVWLCTGKCDTKGQKIMVIDIKHIDISRERSRVSVMFCDGSVTTFDAETIASWIGLGYRK